MSGVDDERRHTQRNYPGSSILSKFVGNGSVDADDEVEGLEAPILLHQPKLKCIDYCATLEASRTPEIELDK